MRIWRLLTLLTLIPFSAWTLNGAAEIGAGAKSKGMGGVAIALPQESFVSAANPAGLVWLCSSVDVGLGYTFQEVRSRQVVIESNATTRQLCTNSDGLWFPEIGVNWRYCCNQSIGLIAFVKGALSTKYDEELFEQSFNTSPSRFDAYTIFLTPSWSWQIAPCLSFGIAINGIIQLHRNNVQYTSIDGSIAPNRPDGIFAGLDTLDVSGGANLRVGLLFCAGNGFGVGLTYQTPALMNELCDYSGQWPRAGYWDPPAELGAGLSYRFCKSLVLSIDWNYLFWNETTTWGNSFQQARLGTSGFTFREGTADGPGFGWVDRTVWKVGVAWNCSCLTLRAGYNYGPSPILSDETYINQLNGATIAHHVTVGASYRLFCGELSGYYYHGFRNTVEGLGPIFGSTSDTINLTNQQNGFGLSYGVDW